MEKNSDKQKKHKPPLNDYIKYSALGVQMIVTLLVFAYLGRWIDRELALKTPWFTLVLSLIGLFVPLYQLAKGLK